MYKPNGDVWDLLMLKKWSSQFYISSHYVTFVTFQSPIKLTLSGLVLLSI